MRALVLIDIQNDFLPGGALPVPDGDQIIPIVNKLMKHHFDLVVATKDWHPAEHGSFAVNHGKKPGEHVMLGGFDQELWPVHCVQGSRGADFPDALDISVIDTVINKGVNKDVDSYSGFFDNGVLRSTGLNEYLKGIGIKDIYIAGLATDYCVKYSVFDALRLGFNVYVIKDACRGINFMAGDSERAFDRMKTAGAKIIESKDISG